MVAIGNTMLACLTVTMPFNGEESIGGVVDNVGTLLFWP